MEAIFKALADPHRRQILDLLFARDGQTLGELCAGFATMTRFGVMKHLRVLEEAGLVTTRKAGREKLHYLNPVPIRLIHDRWISKYAEPWVGALGDLKSALEGTAMDQPKHVFEIYIRTTPEQLWAAITSPEFTRRYFYSTAVESDWQSGSPFTYRQDDGSIAISGDVLEVEPPHRLVTTFSTHQDEETRAERPSRVTWEIEPMGDVCKLTLVHDDFDGMTKTYQEVGSGWPPVLSSLKSLLETGEPLAVSV
jgi:uncharacterized protein YndB with AHSA1/START domain/DNA-binding transcriptional ArsR family regulator